MRLNVSNVSVLGFSVDEPGPKSTILKIPSGHIKWYLIVYTEG